MLSFDGRKKRKKGLGSCPDKIEGSGMGLARTPSHLSIAMIELANERTFSAWIYTGVVAMISGLAISRLLIQENVHLMAEAIGVIMIFIGGSIYIAALSGYSRTLKIIHTGKFGDRFTQFHPHYAYLIVAVLLLSAVVSLFLAVQ